MILSWLLFLNNVAAGDGDSLIIPPQIVSRVLCNFIFPRAGIWLVYFPIDWTCLLHPIRCVTNISGTLLNLVIAIFSFLDNFLSSWSSLLLVKSKGWSFLLLTEVLFTIWLKSTLFVDLVVILLLQFSLPPLLVESFCIKPCWKHFCLLRVKFSWKILNTAFLAKGSVRILYYSLLNFFSPKLRASSIWWLRSLQVSTFSSGTVPCWLNKHSYVIELLLLPRQQRHFSIIPSRVLTNFLKSFSFRYLMSLCQPINTIFLNWVTLRSKRVLLLFTHRFINPLLPNSLLSHHVGILWSASHLFVAYDRSSVICSGAFLTNKIWLPSIFNTCPSLNEILRHFFDLILWKVLYELCKADTEEVFPIPPFIRVFVRSKSSYQHSLQCIIILGYF